ncbi:MAG TPA: hypothetical protein VLA30_08325 [Burkholderiales bacterium]|nr:hypothetical protein [Burkholderiales bacterium]
MGDFGIGQPVERFEDPRLLRGAGRFVHDLSLPGQACLVLVRSPHAHARIVALDAAAARAAPGVLGVYSVEDLRADGTGTSAVALARRRAVRAARREPPGADGAQPARGEGRRRSGHRRRAQGAQK